MNSQSIKSESSAGTYLVFYQSVRGGRARTLFCRPTYVAGREALWDIDGDRPVRVEHNGHYNELRTVGPRGRVIGIHARVSPPSSSDTSK